MTTTNDEDTILQRVLSPATPSPTVAQQSSPENVQRANDDDEEKGVEDPSSSSDDDDDDNSTATSPWISNPTYKTCDNSPGKRKAKSDLWNYIKRLRQDHEKSDSYTHICVVRGCGKLIKLLKPKNKAYYTTTKAFDHVRKKHGSIQLDGKQVSEKKQVSVTG